MARTRISRRSTIATYSDSWFELTYRRFAGAIGALPRRSPPMLVDFGPLPLVPETSADAPPWRGKVAGALVCGSTGGDVVAFADWLRRGEVPTVVMVSDLLDSGVPTVCTDYREIGRIATTHLARDCGCRSFLHVGGRSGNMSTIRREEGFRDALAAHGHELHCFRSSVGDLAENPVMTLDQPELAALLHRLPRPIGVLAMSDPLAAAVAARCKWLGLRIPQDVAVIGSGNTLLAHTHIPSLSSIRVREAEVGAVAMRLLTGMMRGDAAPREPVLIDGCTLYARASTRGGDERISVLAVDIAMEHIRASACSGLTVDGLADLLGISRRRLEVLFQEERGNGPKEEIQRVRFEAAAMLLRSTTKSVTEIAGLTGFEALPPFCRFFQRMIGMRPQEFRTARGISIRAPRRRKT